MKRAIPTEAEKHGIKEWLNLPDVDKKGNCEGDGGGCPFNNIERHACVYDPYSGFSYSYCKKFFPSLSNEACPCTQYSLSYVKRVVRQLLGD